jgi:hypothetical protein
VLNNPILTSGGLPAYCRPGNAPGAERPSCGGSPREGARSELASGAATGGGGRSAPDPYSLLPAESRRFHHQRLSFQVHLASGSGTSRKWFWNVKIRIQPVARCRLRCAAVTGVARTTTWRGCGKAVNDRASSTGRTTSSHGRGRVQVDGRHATHRSARPASARSPRGRRCRGLHSGSRRFTSVLSSPVPEGKLATGGMASRSAVAVDACRDEEGATRRATLGPHRSAHDIFESPGPVALGRPPQRAARQILRWVEGRNSKVPVSTPARSRRAHSVGVLPVWPWRCGNSVLLRQLGRIASSSSSPNG